MTVWRTFDRGKSTADGIQRDDTNYKRVGDMVLRPCEDYGGGGGGGGYADCFPLNGGGGHHFYESIKSDLESFRLRGDDGGDCGHNGGNNSPTAVDSQLQPCNDDASSIASKKRIDSMFKATASVAGDEKRTMLDRAKGGRKTRSLADDGDDYFDYGYATAPGGGANKNTVQEKIEKMFAEISSSELDTDVSIESTAAAAGNKFHVQYIGCAGLSGKISSLEGLQQPVRDMYFGYRENQHQYRRDGERPRDFSGLLEISASGLTIRYRDELGETVHRTDAFPSIAVWAALKYVCRPQSSPRPSRRISPEGAYDTPRAAHEYAFLPLIADPDGSDKAALFRDLDAGDRARLDAAGDHAPVFAVVTRCKAGRPRPLECHGFACETENDALLMAANLYGALVTAMSVVAEEAAAGAQDCGGEPTEQHRLLQREQPQQQQQRRPPSPRRYIRQRNGFTSMSSTAGSSVAGGDLGPPALPPPRPPRRNKKSPSSVGSSAAGDFETAIGPMADLNNDVCSDAKTFRMTVRQPPSLRRGVCNSSSPSPAANEQPKVKGDILTKVAIPRSRSFLNSNGLASGRYSRRAAGCGIETAAADRRRRRSNGSSVMGFSDMFNELRLQEGLNNMDDILNAIINVEGMSYNDLKPIYREFLVKLSMTLTKDELYQRTKAIMTEQKRKRNKRPGAKGSSATSAVGRGRRLNDKLRNALDLRAARSKIGAVLLPDFCRKRNRKARRKLKQRRCACAAEIQQLAGGGRKSQRRAGGNRRTVVGSGAALKGRRPFAHASSSVTCSTSDESEFFAAAVAARQRHNLQLKQQQHHKLQLQLQLQQQQQKQQQQHHQAYRKSKLRGGSKGSSGRGTASEGGCMHRASSGYFSCSECSAGAADDKCYCGGGGGGGVMSAGAQEPTSLVSCSCDSDSCAESDKCYCGRPRRPRNIFDELKSRGFAASESSVSRADSPGTAWKKNELMMLLQQRQDVAGSSSSPAATVGGGGSHHGVRCGIEPSKSIEYLQVARRPVAAHNLQQPHYSSVASKPPVAAATGTDRMKVYGDHSTTTTAAGSTSSPASSLSAATVYSSSSAVGGGAAQLHRRQQRRSGSSGSDNFRAIDYALFATNGGGGGGRKSRGCGGGGGRQQLLQHTHYRPACPPAVKAAAATPSAMANRRSYSSEAVHLTGCHLYHNQQQLQHHQHHQQHQHQHHRPLVQTKATRRHSVHNGGADDVLSSFFKSDIENSLGYYP